MSKQYVILGMHRSGTSVVASWLHVMGVNMGDQLLGARQGNPWGHWECIEFMELNQDVLKAAGGNWHHPPSHEEIMDVESQFEERISLLVEYYDQENEAWGFKDPRTCLTAELYHRHLSDPTYIVTQRDDDAIAASLLKRHEPVYEFQPDHWYLDHWAALTQEYQERIAAFLNRHELGAHHIDYEACVDRRRAHGPINDLADLIGARPRDVRKAFHQVRFVK